MGRPGRHGSGLPKIAGGVRCMALSPRGGERVFCWRRSWRRAAVDAAGARAGGGRASRMAPVGPRGTAARRMPRLRRPWMNQPMQATRRRMARMVAAAAASSCSESGCALVWPVRRRVGSAAQRTRRGARSAARRAGARDSGSAWPRSRARSRTRNWPSRDRPGASCRSCGPGAAAGGMPGRARGPAGMEGFRVMALYLTNCCWRRKRLSRNGHGL